MSWWAVIWSLFGRWAAVLGVVQFIFGLWSFLAAEAELQVTNWLHPARYLPDWPWWSWAISLLVSVLAVVVVNAARLIGDRDETISSLQCADDLPRFRFVDARGTTLTRGAPSVVGTSSDSGPVTGLAAHAKVGTFWALRLRLENQPAVKSQRSDATNVAARLRFFGGAGTQPDLEFFGRWTAEAAPRGRAGPSRRFTNTRTSRSASPPGPARITTSNAVEATTIMPPCDRSPSNGCGFSFVAGRTGPRTTRPSISTRYADTGRHLPSVLLDGTTQMSMPPSPILAVTAYGPRVVPGGRVIGGTITGSSPHF